MTIKARIERLEGELGTSDGAPIYAVLLYDLTNPPDFEEVVRKCGATRVLLLPHNDRCDLAPGQLLCGANPQA